MAVHIISLGEESVEAAGAWARENTRTFRNVFGIEQVIFMRSTVPPKAGAVMVFESDDALVRYKITGPHERFVESLQKASADGDNPVREEA